MGNILCPDEGITKLASVAREICPFPNYNPNPLFVDMLSINSSLHLRNHYTAVQSSLSPKQLEDFTQGLRSTFGREGNVTLGGVGVVALSLAVLFDTLARQVKGERVSDSGPIPGLFVTDLRGYYPPQVYTISEYLRLVPHIANNPARMKEATVRYHKQLMINEQYLKQLGENHTLPLREDITSLNWFLSHVFAFGLQLHHSRIKNAGDHELFTPEVSSESEYEPILSLNCDLETANEVFLAKIQESDKLTQEDFDRLIGVQNGLLQEVAKQELGNAILAFTCSSGSIDSRIAQREDFDLRANALGKWAE